ncbi:hypothetical protein [Prauserella endophytica]|uniref:Uncharacterized protein n=1 Tax=Prauserella endophytica TaxID=1592324 RepID=A0ABY2S8G6_9PSEU|nr:hypothetical protein [Prauserella endophytica]TKG71912.1 hypothetical protein FCN18_10530 [Prauserella endophytica]
MAAKLDGRLSAPTPSIEQTGEEHGRRSILRAAAPGPGLDTVWPRLSTSDRRLRPAMRGCGRESNLNGYLRRLRTAPTLDALALTWFGR